MIRLLKHRLGPGVRIPCILQGIFCADIFTEIFDNFRQGTSVQFILFHLTDFHERTKDVGKNSLVGF